MKKLNFMAIFIAFLSMNLMFASCSKDDDVVEEVDYGTAVSGVYTGKRSIGTSVVSDAYVVTISRINSNTVNMSAEFFGSGGSENFNVIKQGDTYVLINESSNYNISSSISGKTLTVNYLTNGYTMMTYVGVKD